MRFVKPLLLSLLSLFLLVGSPALGKDPATQDSGKTTVGDFALKVVQLAEDDPAVRGSLTADQALARLQRAGLRFQGASSDPLTERDKSAFFFAVAKGLMDKMVAVPDGFDSCTSQARTPDCRACCLSLPGATNQSCGKACGQAHAALQHASPSEPTP